MQVDKRWFLDFRPEEIEEIRQNQELVVVVDLWAATTNIILMLTKKPSRLVIVDDEKYATAKNLYQRTVLIGESDHIPPESFAAGSNRTFDVDQVDIDGKTVLYLSFNGARVIEAFAGPQKGLVFVGAMTNFGVLAKELLRLGPDKVNIVAAGNLTGKLRGAVFVEDFMGAEILEKELKGQRFDLEAERDRMKREMLGYLTEDLEDADEKVWPYIFGPQVDILATAFINKNGFAEVLRLRHV